MSSASTAGWELVDQYEEVVYSPTGESLIGHQRSPMRIKVPMWSFESEGQRIISDLAVSVEIITDAELCIAECESLHVYSHGDSIDECLAELQHQVVYFFEDYSRRSEDEVTGLAVRLRELYVNHFAVCT